MKIIALMVAAVGLAFGVTSHAFAVDRTLSGDAVFAQEDCADGETWNEETQACEKSEG